MCVCTVRRTVYVVSDNPITTVSRQDFLFDESKVQINFVDFPKCPTWLLLDTRQNIKMIKSASC